MAKFHLLVNRRFIFASLLGMVILSRSVNGNCDARINVTVGRGSGEIFNLKENSVFNGSPTKFEISQYVFNNQERNSDFIKFYCGEMSYSDERKYICIHRRAGILKIRKNVQFSDVPARSIFAITVKVFASQVVINICKLDIHVMGNGTHDDSDLLIPQTTTASTSVPSATTTTPSATTTTTTTSAPKTSTVKVETPPTTSPLVTTKKPSTTADPCASAKILAHSLHTCIRKQRVLHARNISTATRTLYFDLTSSVIPRVLSVVAKPSAIGVIRRNKPVKVKLYAAVASTEPIQLVKIKEANVRILNAEQSISIDVYLPSNVSWLSFEVYENGKTPLSLPGDSFDIVVATYEFCMRQMCLTLYGEWMKLRASQGSGSCLNPIKNPILHFDTCFDMCESEQTTASTGDIYLWPRTHSSVTASVACNKTDGYATRKCQHHGSKVRPSWGPVKDNECKSVEKQRDEGLSKLQDAKISAANASQAAQELNNLTKTNPQSLPPGQLKKITDILEQLGAFATDEKVADQMLDTVDNCMQASDESFKGGEANNNISARMISVLSTVCDAMVKGKSEFTAVKKGFALAGARQNKTSFKGITISYQASSSSSGSSQGGSLSLEKSAKQQTGDTSTSLMLPAGLLSDNQVETPTFLFIAYDSGKLFQEGGRRDRLHSKVISAEVKNNKIAGLKSPIVTRFKNSNASTASKLCTWWDFKLENGKGGWSQQGCKVHKVENGYTTCHCDHLTNFAVLLGAQEPVKGSIHAKALSIVSYIGVAISLAGVLFTLLSYSIFPKLRENNPPKILMNLCTALALLLIVYAVGVEQTEPRQGCQAVAFILHYSILCVLAWSAVEGFTSYRGIVKPMNSEIPKLMRKAAIAGWGVPLIFPIIGISIWTDKYGDSQSCVVRGLPLYTTLIAPVALVMLLNVVSIFSIMFALNRSSKMYTHNAIKLLHRIRIIATFVLLFSLTWLFGFLVVSNDVIALQYVFCIMNSLQGFFIFLFYCVRNENVRKSWKDQLTARQRQRSRYAARKSDPSYDSATFHKTDSLRSDYTNKTSSIDSSTRITVTNSGNSY
eukprot:gene14278-15765_t